MKDYYPSQRETDLHLVLSYCAKTIFASTERFAINQERSKLMNGDKSYKQSSILERKIQAVLEEIKRTGWQPET